MFYVLTVKTSCILLYIHRKGNIRVCWSWIFEPEDMAALLQPSSRVVCGAAYCCPQSTSLRAGLRGKLAFRAAIFPVFLAFWSFSLASLQSLWEGQCCTCELPWCGCCCCISEMTLALQQEVFNTGGSGLGMQESAVGCKQEESRSERNALMSDTQP